MAENRRRGIKVKRISEHFQRRMICLMMPHWKRLISADLRLSVDDSIIKICEGQCGLMYRNMGRFVSILAHLSGPIGYPFRGH